MVTSSAPRSLDCTATSTAVMPPPITTTRRPIGKVDLSAAWRSSAMKSTARAHPDELIAPECRAVDVAEADAEEHGVMQSRKLLERDVAAERLPVADRDTADLQQPVDLRLGKAVDRLVGGDAVLVEAADLGLRFVDDDVMAVHGEPVGAGKPGRAGADDGHSLAGHRGRARRAGRPCA